MIEIFKRPNIDWMGKKAIFITLSVLLLVPGAISVVLRGFNPGIDFSGGSMAEVGFRQKPSFDAIRDALAKQGINKDEIVLQDFQDAKNQVLIRLPQTAAETQDKGIDAGKSKIINAMNSLANQTPNDNIIDINNVGVESLRQKLTELDPLQIRSQGETAASQKYQQIATSLLDYRNRTATGLVNSPSDVPLVGEAFNGLDDAQKGRLRDVLNKNFFAGNYKIEGVESVSATVGAELRARAIYVTMAALFGMLLYIGFRFEWIYGVGAVVAVFHDVMITLGLFSIFHKEISLTVIAALLTLVGYSMNDTIVIFDRIRENIKLRRRDDLVTIVNDSINQTLSRTVLTSGLTLIAALSLWLFGGPVLNGFSLALVIGIIIGTYSSIAVASPIMVWWKLYSEQQERRPVNARVPAGGAPGTTTPVKAK